MNLARNALLLMILLTTGCMALVAGGVAAVGTYTYVSGQLNRTYNANLERTYNAALAGCQALGLGRSNFDKQEANGAFRVYMH